MKILALDIATHTGIGSTTGVVFIFEVLDDLLEIVSEVECVERDVQNGCHTSCVACISDRAAASMSKCRAANGFSRASKPHEAGDHVKSLLHQQGCSDRRVDST